MEATDLVVFRDVWIIIMDILCPKYLRKEAVIRSTELIPLFNLACTSKNFNELVAQRLHNIRERNIVRKSSQQSVCSYLALNGWLSLLQAAVTRGYEMDKDTMDCAAASGNLDCLKYARKCGCTWDAETTALAASNSTECLIYLHQNGCPWDHRASEAAALSGSLERLQYICKNRGRWSSKTCANAATISLECLQYLHVNGCMWDPSTLLEAARCNQLSCLEYAFERGCPQSNKLCEVAAENGAMDCLKYLHTHGCSFSTETCLKALLSHNFECLVYVLENGCHVPESILEDAAFEHDEQALKYLLSKGCKWISSRRDSVCEALAVADDVIGLQLAYLHGCPLVESMMYFTARYGSVQAAKFGLAHGFKVNKKFMKTAMSNNELELVKLGHENGAPWPKKLQYIYLDRPSIVKYAYENGCHLPKHIVKELLSKSQLDSAIYCLEQGAQWSEKNLKMKIRSFSVCQGAFIKFVRAKFPAQEITKEQDDENERQGFL